MKADEHAKLLAAGLAEFIREGILEQIASSAGQNWPRWLSRTDPFRVQDRAYYGLEENLDRAIYRYNLQHR